MFFGPSDLSDSAFPAENGLSVEIAQHSNKGPFAPPRLLYPQSR